MKASKIKALKRFLLFAFFFQLFNASMDLVVWFLYNFKIPSYVFSAFIFSSSILILAIYKLLDYVK